MKIEQINHQFGPFFQADSQILILGTMPSPKSREQGFYYGHPRNRFWPVLADLLQEEFPDTVEDRKALLDRNKIALWDVLARCEIAGADDSSIKNPVANDMGVILDASDIKAVFTTGTKASNLYRKLCYPLCGQEDIRLPSTSPANCGCSYEKLKNEYSRILEYLK